MYRRRRKIKTKQNFIVDRMVDILDLFNKMQIYGNRGYLSQSFVLNSFIFESIQLWFNCLSINGF